MYSYTAAKLPIYQEQRAKHLKSLFDITRKSSPQKTKKQKKKKKKKKKNVGGIRGEGILGASPH